MALFMSTASYLCAQETGKSPASAQPAQRDYRFEVASLRPGSPPTGWEYKAGPQGYTPGRFRETNMQFSAMAWDAFKVKRSYQIEYPRWMDSTFFTINATLPEGADKADLPIMFKHLLEDRFGIVFHHETRQMAGYELVVAKSGSRLARSTRPGKDMTIEALTKGEVFEMKNGALQFTKDAGSYDGSFSGGSYALHGRDKTMSDLAANLAEKLNAPVMDATGLEGGYDYTLIFTPEPMSRPGIVVSPGGGVPIAGLPDRPLEHPLLRDALREQLGLELRPVKNVSIDVVVIDSANKVPTEN
jgi:uncharacterized protein (TIGR03435 family)